MPVSSHCASLELYCLWTDQADQSVQSNFSVKVAFGRDFYPFQIFNVAFKNGVRVISAAVSKPFVLF